MGALCSKNQDVEVVDEIDVSRHKVVGKGDIAALANGKTKQGQKPPEKADGK